MWSLGRLWYIPNVGIQAQKAMELLGVKPTRPTNITQWFTTLEEIKSTAQETAWLNGLQTAVQLVLATGDPMRMHWQT
jgi:hypothetical protein